MSVSEFDFYRENNRIEAKKASRGLPQSIWETYSAFANTNGGIILLGVVENSSKLLEVVGVDDPEKLMKEFWDSVNNPNKVNVCILSNKDVYTRTFDGKRIVCIDVPVADRRYRPVFINGNPLTGTYRRNGEGDYRCTADEYQAMVRDSSSRTQDMLVLEDISLEAFNVQSIRGYRQVMSSKRPGHVWENLDDQDFLLRIGAVGIGKDGERHPTSAGLLMFADEYNIVTEYPQYFLDYQEQYNTYMRWTDRIISSSGEWSGNIFDFFFKVYNRLVQDIKVPFAMDGAFRIDDTPLHKALREVLVNCLVNADYYGRGGIVIKKSDDGLLFSNPGRFRMEIEAAKVGGLSDPRNSTIMKMFNLIDIGERSGSGIPSVLSTWAKTGWDEPEIIELSNPDRIEVFLPMHRQERGIGDKGEKSAIRVGDKGEKSAIISNRKSSIVEYLEYNGTSSAREMADYVGLKASRLRDYLGELVEDGMVVAEGSNRNRRYRLRDS